MAVKAMPEGDSYGPEEYVLRQDVEAIGRICDQLKDAERQLARFVNCTTRPDAAQVTDNVHRPRLAGNYAL